MRSCLRSLAPLGFVALALVSLGCGSKDEELQAMAVPTSTGIPMAPPGAVGADVDPKPVPRPPRPNRSEGIEQKIDPKPGNTLEPTPPSEPVIPPSPFGTPPDPDDDEPTPPVTTKKKPQGTKI